MKLKMVRMDSEAKDPETQCPAVKWSYGPVGWWRVTTEGDVEGRTIKDLGWHYGHIVEIALCLGPGPCYKYEFSPPKDAPDGMFGEPKVYPERRQVRRQATILIPSESGTGQLSSGMRVKWFRQWLDAEEVCVTESNHQSAVCIRLKESD